MAKATLDSTRPLLSPPVRSVQPPNRYPSVCGAGDCAHLQCNAVSHQIALPCCGCQKVIPSGADLYILEREGAVVKRQMCATCFNEGRRR